jgi:orotate phosphoribosyltransferase
MSQDPLVALLREKSVKFGRFTLASGAESDFYVDARQTTLHAVGARLVAERVLARLRPDVVAVGGLTMGADPIACSVAALSCIGGRPVHAFLIRKEAKGHGTGRVIEGLANVPEGSAVAIVEDTTTTGGSLLQAVERAVEAGLRVVQCLTVVDRLEGAGERVAAAGYTLEALVTRRDLELG